MSRCVTLTVSSSGLAVNRHESYGAASMYMKASCQKGKGGTKLGAPYPFTVVGVNYPLAVAQDGKELSVLDRIRGTFTLIMRITQIPRESTDNGMKKLSQ